MKKSELQQLIREEISKILNENEEITIELYTGAELIGPANKKAEVLKLKKEIESAMKSAFRAAKGMGSESQAMDERDDTLYEFEDELKKINYRIA